MLDFILEHWQYRRQRPNSAVLALPALDLSFRHNPLPSFLMTIEALEPKLWRLFLPQHYSNLPPQLPSQLSTTTTANNDNNNQSPRCSPFIAFLGNSPPHCAPFTLIGKVQTISIAQPSLSMVGVAQWKTRTTSASNSTTTG